MSETPRSSSRLAVSAVLLLCAGAGAWFCLDGGAVSLKPSVSIQAEAEKEAGPVKAEAEARSAVHKEKSAHQVVAPLNSGPRQPVLSQEEKVQARVDEALSSTAKPMAGGDSAGGALAAAVCQMARDRGTDTPIFQLLVYPVTDRRMDNASCRNYTDTPMWNAKLSEKMWQGYVQNANAADIAYASPMEAECFEDLPAAYVETAEFDCLHDEGVAYAQAMQKAGIDVVLNETKGTMHGFDIVEKAPTTQAAVAARIGFMKEQFNKAINKKSEV